MPLSASENLAGPLAIDLDCRHFSGDFVVFNYAWERGRLEYPNPKGQFRGSLTYVSG